MPPGYPDLSGFVSTDNIVRKRISVKGELVIILAIPEQFRNSLVVPFLVELNQLVLPPIDDPVSV